MFEAINASPRPSSKLTTDPPTTPSPSIQIQDKMVFANLLSQCSHDTVQFVLLVVSTYNFMLIAILLASPLTVAKVRQVTVALRQVYWVKVVKAARSVVDACYAPLMAAIASLKASIALLAAETATARKEQEELRNEMRDELRKVCEDIAEIKAVVHELAKDRERDRRAQPICTGTDSAIGTATATGTSASASARACTFASAIDTVVHVLWPDA